MNKSNNYKERQPVDVTTTVTELVGRNDDRIALILFNQGTENVQLSFGANPDNWFELEASKGMHFPITPKNAVSAKTASGTATVSVLEA